MPNSYLTVHIKVEAMYLASERQVASPLADFSKLPWNDGTQDINFDQPFVSDGIVHEPFASQGLILGKGVHLHFIVPHYLGEQRSDSSSSDTTTTPATLPAAPNRWFVTRNSDNERWLIESDHIHDESYDPSNPDKQDEITCIIPYSGPIAQPYRYMGRKTQLASGTTLNETIGQTYEKTNPSSFKSVGGKALTVVGYGDINFSSFYPNCLGVFGFHDPDGIDKGSYTIVGWNSESKDDLLTQTISNTINNNSGLSQTELNSAIEKELAGQFHLDLNLNDQNLTSADLPMTLFIGEVTSDSNLPTTDNIQISVGSTGTEALSALIADKYCGGDDDLKTTIEEQLEASLLQSKLAHLLTDTGPKFLEARHEKGFRASHSGHSWKISQIYPQVKSATADTSTQLPLSTQLAALLDTLNSKQKQFDQANHKLATLKEQLFYDWNKYMHARYIGPEERGQYPDADHIMYFIETYGLSEIKKQVGDTGQLAAPSKNDQFIPLASTKDTNQKSYANQLVKAWNDVQNVVNTENSTVVSNALEKWEAANKKQTEAAGYQKSAQLEIIKEQVTQLQLTATPGPRYWEANAPALLVSGLAGSEESVSANLKCSLVSGSDLSTSTFQNLFQSSEQVWRPFILDWQIDLIDTALEQDSGAFDSEGLKNNFSLNPTGPDLQQSSTYKAGNLSVFSGTALLSSHAKHAVMYHIKNLVSDIFKKDSINLVAGKSIDDFLTGSTWVDAYQTLIASDSTISIPSTVDYKNPLCSIQAAYSELQKGEVISQTLNGFNQALIMLKKVHQLPIKEPIGFGYESGFTSTVAQHVGNNRHSSPIMAFDFNPIRSGKMSINRLNLIDNFGRVASILPNNSTPVIASETMLEKKQLFLRPRLAQAARLNFRWLSAQSGADLTTADMETNDPSTSPICGWLMSDYLNNTFAVFDSDGTALGYIDSDASWQVPPGSNQAENIQSNITNSHLLAVVEKFRGDASFLNDFITTSQTALNNIAPSNVNLQDTKALLMGRPMAVVRSSLSFELKDLHALNQNWSSLLIDLNNCDSNPPWYYSNRNQNKWTDMQLPYRLGEHAQLNDGLVGYWMESNGVLSNSFITPEGSAGEEGSTDIQTSDTSQVQTQWLALNSEEVKMTMLMDPRGVVHATSGILPTKAISIPPDYYLDSMKKLNMWFQTGPILQPNENDATNLRLNLPTVPGYEWQWWDEAEGTLKIKKESSQKEDESSSEIRKGWLKLIPQQKTTTR